MKTVLSIAVAVVMPFGLFVLAGVVVGRIIAKHRETRSSRDAMRRHWTQSRRSRLIDPSKAKSPEARSVCARKRVSKTGNVRQSCAALVAPGLRSLSTLPQLQRLRMMRDAKGLPEEKFDAN